jgi:hypothetical protein
LRKKSAVTDMRRGNYLKGMTEGERQQMDAAIACQVFESFNNRGIRETRVGDRVRITLPFGVVSDLRVEQQHMDAAIKMKDTIETKSYSARIQ